MALEIPIQVQALADRLSLVIEGPTDRAVSAIGNLRDAREGTLCALFERRFIDEARQTSATAVLSSRALSAYLPPDCTQLISDEPRADWGRILRFLFPHPLEVPPAVGIHGAAWVEARPT